MGKWDGNFLVFLQKRRQVEKNIIAEHQKKLEEIEKKIRIEEV